METDRARLVAQCEAAAQAADALVGQIKRYLDAGLAAPPHLVRELAMREDDLLDKLAATRQFRLPSDP